MYYRTFVKLQYFIRHCIWYQDGIVSKANKLPELPDLILQQDVKTQLAGIRELQKELKTCSFQELQCCRGKYSKIQ